MSGIEIFGVILGLYPVIVELAQTYKRMRGSGSADLNRGVIVASAMYDDTVKKILESAVSQQEMQRLVPGQGPIDQPLWQEPALQRKLLARLGSEKLDLTIGYLSQMKTSLDQVKTELTNMCRGTEVLDRFRTTIRMTLANMSHSGIRERVKQIRALNRELRELLDDRRFLRSHQEYRKESAISINIPQSGGHTARNFFEAISGTYTCACARAHVIGLGCYCTACVQPFKEQCALHSTDEWDFCLAFPVRPETPSDVAVTVLLESIPDNDIDASTIRNICSLIRDVATESEDRQVLIDIANNDRMYRMKVTKIDASDAKPPSIKYFAELIQSGNGLSTKDRLELALRLSLAIVQLCKTPWVSESWTWNDVCVSQAAVEDGKDHEDNAQKKGNNYIKFPGIFILREIYSVTYKGDRASELTAVNVPRIMADVLDEEPVLTKLGLALIELAIGKSIQEMKEEYGLDATVEDEFANICLARMLLKNGKICNEASAVYESVVKVCIGRRYIDMEGQPRSLLSQHESFLSSFREAIILPLFEVWKRYDL